MRTLLIVTCFFVALSASAAPSAEPSIDLPLALHPDNPHYFLFRGKPTILISSGEHYGCVLNLDFDYARYLEALHAAGLNHTRLFSGTYHEGTGWFGIVENTLAPAPGRLLCPWPRTATPGAADGGGKFDLTRWDPAYFDRLRDFMAQASRQDVVVEFNLFCPNYDDGLWKISPMNAANNVNAIGDCPRTEVFTLKHKDLLAVQDALTRKMVNELRDFDNLYFEVCNEPYFGGITMEWQFHIADVIVDAEKDLKARHLISFNIANGSTKVTQPHPAASIFNFHYCAPPDAIAMNYALDKVIGNNETGFKGSKDVTYRTQAWDFILAGGGLFNNLDYSFTVKHPDGTAVDYKAPGGGSPAFRQQMSILKQFMEGFEFIHMAPANNVIQGTLASGTTARALAEPGKQYALYIKGGTRADLKLNLPAGTYTVQWLNTKTGKIDATQILEHPGGVATLNSPEYLEDIALDIKVKR